MKQKRRFNYGGGIRERLPVRQPISCDELADTPPVRAICSKRKPK